ncbi:hypothetical protein EJ05DRAFT_523319 [Pseudovirgaria hyperparasitica]|uniref:Uncharacterized protein n=1 Tax=Pseudovirgaria hyperparasitica TaxID=470096 RepID=A0A6A6VRE7_9PEZI|nr:uncharacterized protein EJ05DRAFT_523319 [Pseudovirgaria hyperparasitica]KAF2753172.1 hypothetical protein EJ05DRAFT_523319 [Pseudovirgaria hyperparasitica]
MNNTRPILTTRHSHPSDFLPTIASVSSNSNLSDLAVDETSSVESTPSPTSTSASVLVTERPRSSWLSDKKTRNAGTLVSPTQGRNASIWSSLAEGKTARPKRKYSVTGPNSTESLPEPASPSPSKKQRRGLLPRAPPILDDTVSNSPESCLRPPPSPLFFSHTKQERPQLPPRFSSSEAGARMLSKAGREDSSIKTVILARGTFDAISPHGSTSVMQNRASSERSSIPPESADRHDPLRLLGSVGIVELLEQDIRPTFIIDLAGAYNYGPSALHPVFTNSSLRSDKALYHRLLDIRSRESSPIEPMPKSLSHFKAWILDGVVQGEVLDVALPPFEHAGHTWSCTTIRKRLRIVSGAREAPRVTRASSQLTLRAKSASAGSDPASFLEDISPRSPALPTVLSSTENVLESQDYFGTPAPQHTVGDELPDADVILQDHVVEPPSLGTTWPSLENKVKHNDVSYSLDTHPSLTNECVLRASVAGDVDWFSRAPSPHKELGGFFDWTRLPITDALPRHIRFARSVDWASTSLGPIEYWSSDLRQMCNLIMASPHPAAMYWGDDLIAIYNEAYVLLAGQKHPKLMGQSYREAWAEIWDDVKEPFAEAKLTGQATMKDDDCLFIKRFDWLEETYFSWSIIPMVGGDGSVMGLYNPAFEKTRRKIAERRMLTLREVGERTAAARDVKGFWQQVLTALATNDHDTPFVMLYSVFDENDSDSASMHSASLISTKQCMLEGALGVPEGHQSAPALVELKTSSEGFAPIFREVMKTDKPVQLKVGKDIALDMITGIEWRGFGDPYREVIVCPIHPTTGDTVLGFLVMGVNPRRPYDDDYSLFVQLLSRQLATSLASVVLFEEEIRRGQKAAKLAALDRMELSEQLRDSETRFTRMAEFSPAGLFIADSAGHINYCNDTWYEVSRVPRDVTSTDRWIEAIREDDQEKVRATWAKVVEEKEVVRCEFRFKTPWVAEGGERSDTWVLFSAYPETDVLGELKSVFGSITDISSQKWAEGLQRRKMEEAVELKRQQENFIDITSHEMRNPLSAILQCADEISTSLTDFRSSEARTIDDKLVSGSIDAAQTIALCALHQKRIVDDVLTLSKLDSAMLQVTPVDVQPLTVVQRALKMFEGEVATADINLTFNVDESYEQQHIDWVKLDPSRVLQVLINLTTNAIKFTTTEKKRTITVGIAAFNERPSKAGNAIVKYFPPRGNMKAQMEAIDYGHGDVVYLQFSVQDTGRGLNDEEKKLLFLRFSQASPRTHVQYGGSGLGLFISRELTELQGGEIGVASEAGKGSTFAFYVKCRKSEAPEHPLDQLPVTIGRHGSAFSASEAKFGIGKREGATKARDFAVGPEKEKSPAVTATKDRKHINVLIVEDNLVNQRVLQKQLTNVGFKVTVANHGGEALDALQSSKIWHKPPLGAKELHVVLMDQEMPVMDGLQATKKIRQWEGEGQVVRHIPIIAVTANARPAQIQTLMDVGMDNVVSKPFRIPDLVPTIEELFDKHFET